MITLESMAEYEQVHSHEIVRRLWCYLVISFEDLLLTQLLTVLDHFDEFVILVFLNGVALFKDDGTHFSELLLQPNGLDLQLRCRPRVDE